MSIVYHRERQCVTAQGVAKKAYSSFDEAQHIVTQTRPDRMHAYRCSEHGWHVGHNFDRHGQPRA
jgi:hypothetical protein